MKLLLRILLINFLLLSGLTVSAEDKSKIGQNEHVDCDKIAENQDKDNQKAKDKEEGEKSDSKDL